jgi:uncharacterized membrane protein
MTEERSLALVIASVFLIGAVGLILTGGLGGDSAVYGEDVYVYEYRADFYPNGTLEELFVYQISTSGKYRMLYRSFKDPLARGELNKPYFELLELRPPLGTTTYIRDYSGRVEVLSGDPSMVYDIQSLALINEVGCYRPERFSRGRYEIGYRFKVHPPLECDNQYCHLNLKLADEHLPYRSATIAIHDENGSLRRIFPHPPMDVVQTGDVWLIRGPIPKDELVEVEILFAPEVAETLDGFSRNVAEVGNKTFAANDDGHGGVDWYTILERGLTGLILLLPAGLFLIHRRYGREKEYTVPETLSYVPEKRKPWLVNLVFNGDSFDFNENGFYATILDFQRRGIIEIESEMIDDNGLLTSSNKANLKMRLLKAPRIWTTITRRMFSAFSKPIHRGAFSARQPLRTPSRG